MKVDNYTKHSKCSATKQQISSGLIRKVLFFKQNKPRIYFIYNVTY